MCYRAAGAQVVGVHDPDRARASALADMCGARVFETFESLFAEQAELASVCSPPGAHFAQAVSAARDASRVTFVEKPVATELADLERLARARCVPVVQWRAGRALVAVRDAVREGLLGDAPTASADCAWSRDENYFAGDRASRARWGCGVLLSIGVHAVDAMCFALGRPIARASGAIARRAHAPHIEVETSAALHLAFDGGALAALRATFDAGPDATRLAFAGGGVTAVIEGGEVDPTASSVAWSCADSTKLARLHAIEHRARGSIAAPLVVPFMLQAIARVREGQSPGDEGATDALPSIASTLDAHRAILDVYDESSRTVTASREVRVASR